jgi:hypothetical protein
LGVFSGLGGGFIIALGDNVVDKLKSKKAEEISIKVAVEPKDQES